MWVRDWWNVWEGKGDGISDPGLGYADSLQMQVGSEDFLLAGEGWVAGGRLDRQGIGAERR